jgi:hypothetical protein
VSHWVSLHHITLVLSRLEVVSNIRFTDHPCKERVRFCHNRTLGEFYPQVVDNAGKMRHIAIEGIDDRNARWESDAAFIPIS